MVSWIAIKFSTVGCDKSVWVEDFQEDDKVA